jgi:hypothetical protein
MFNVKVNLVHVEMPNGGTGTKRSEINLEKHLAKKGSIIRIQNKDELCLTRALVVSIAKIENDSRYKVIANHRRPMQTRLAHDLHQKAGVPIGSCGIECSIGHVTSHMGHVTGQIDINDIV